MTAVKAPVSNSLRQISSCNTYRYENDSPHTDMRMIVLTSLAQFT